MLSIAEARALITTSLSDSDLTAAIEREEAWLARRIGPLEGARTETFSTPDGDEVLQLQRPATAASVVVTDGSGVVTGYELRGWADIVPDGHVWRTGVDVDYTADDANEVKRAIITLLRLTLTESGYLSENAEGYMATSSMADRRAIKAAAWRSLLRRRVVQSVRLVSAVPAGGNTIESVQVVAAAS